MRNRAFTLVEIVVVVVIIAILATIGLMNFNEFLQRGREREAVTQLRSIATALKEYEMRAKVFPDAGDDLSSLADINTNLGLNLIEQGMTYSCVDVGDLEYDCRAVSDAHGWVLHVRDDGAGNVFDAHCYHHGTTPSCPTCNDGAGGPATVDCY